MGCGLQETSYDIDNSRDKFLADEEYESGHQLLESHGA